MKKKLLALVCALVMIFSLASCGLSTPDTVGKVGDFEVSSGLYLLAQFSAYQQAAQLADKDQDTTRVVTSSGTDTYSAMAAALCSLKGPRHGGANLMVMQMMQNIRENLHDQEDDEELEAYLKKLLHGEAFDHKGLIYGMGHAVYSLSDPREVVFKGYVEQLAHEKGRDKDLALYAKIERMAPQLIAEERKIFKGVSPNVDFYSGFVYDMLGIPMELYTPLFAVARIMGWSAHRIEELLSANKIIRPAYKSLGGTHDYIPRDAR